MKKLSLEMLTSDEVLNRNQMASIVGGASYRCNCVGSTGSWTGTYASQAEAEDRGVYNCSSYTASCTLIQQ